MGKDIKGRELSSVQVTIPVEQHGEGSAPSDSEEDFDRERQHSVLPHKAGNQPFRSKVLTLDDDGETFRKRTRAKPKSLAIVDKTSRVIFVNSQNDAHNFPL